MKATKDAWLRPAMLLCICNDGLTANSAGSATDKAFIAMANTTETAG